MFGSHARPGMRGRNSLNLGSLTGSSLAGSTLSSDGFGSLGADTLSTSTQVGTMVAPVVNTGAVTAQGAPFKSPDDPTPRKTNWLLVGAAGLAAYLVFFRKS